MLSSLEKIHRSVSKFLYPLTLKEACAKIVEEAQLLVNAQFGSIFIEDPNNKKTLRRIYSTLPKPHLTPSKTGFTYQCFKTGKPLIKHRKDLGTSPIYAHLNIQSNIFIPLISKSKPVGVLIVNSTKDTQFTFKELSLLKIFGSFATMTINKAQLFEDVKKQLELRDLFISMAAHELRTPLTTINGYIQLLSNKLPKDQSVESRWIYLLYRESQRLTALVNELLQVNRIKSGQLQYMFKECKVTEILNRAVENFRMIKPEREVMFSNLINKSEDIIIGDFDKLLQVVTNVIENADKYSSQNSTVEVKLYSLDDDVILKVKDNGIGISQKDLEKIFEGFYKVDKDSPEGMGLGLFITKSIIKQHRGEIEIVSKLNKGTSVIIKLPKANL